MLTQYDAIEFPTLPESEIHVNVEWRSENEPLPTAFHLALHQQEEFKQMTKQLMTGLCILLVLIVTVILFRQHKTQ